MRIRTSANDPLDFCARHAPGPVLAARRYDSGQPDGPDGRGNCYVYDDEHPDYDGEHRCAICRCVLGDHD